MRVKRFTKTYLLMNIIIIVDWVRVIIADKRLTGIKGINAFLQTKRSIAASHNAPQKVCFLLADLQDTSVSTPAKSFVFDTAIITVSSYPAFLTFHRSIVSTGSPRRTTCPSLTWLLKPSPFMFTV